MLKRIVASAILTSLLIFIAFSAVCVADDAVLSTACKRLRVYDTGLLSNNEPDASLDFIDDCDTFSAATNASIYLNVGTPIITRLSGADTLIYHMYGTQPGDSNAFLTVGSFLVDSTTFTDYTYAQSELVTADGQVGCIVESYFPKSPDTCDAVIQRYKFFSTSGSSVNNVVCGALCDWDVPSDSGVRNTFGFDITRNYIGQRGVEFDTVGHGACPQLEDDRFGGMAMLGDIIPRGGIVIDNWTYVNPAGPYGALAPLPRTAMFELMNSQEGYTGYSSPNPDSQFVDLSTLMIFEEIDLFPGDTMSFTVALVTTKDGQSSLNAAIDKANVWAEMRGLIETDCCVVPGDFNGDGQFNMGDCVYGIYFIFPQYWPQPTPKCLNAADLNHDCAINIGDAVYCINYIFKGGPAPQCGCVN